jgi:hypothetical protein
VVAETFQIGGARVQELHGTSTCSLGESWDLKHAADFEMPLYVLVWDDLPHSSQHYIAPSPPALAGSHLALGVAGVGSRSPLAVRWLPWRERFCGNGISCTSSRQNCQCARAEVRFAQD